MKLANVKPEKLKAFSYSPDLIPQGNHWRFIGTLHTSDSKFIKYLFHIHWNGLVYEGAYVDYPRSDMPLSEMAFNVINDLMGIGLLK